MTASSTQPRVALITGAAGIIGPGVCAALKADGWLVAAADYDKGGMERYERFHGQPFPADLRLEGDLCRESDCRRLVEETVARFGRLDLLVNGATAEPSAQSLMETTVESFEKTLKVDVLAPVVMIQAAAEALSAAHGAVINFSSVLLRTVPEGRLRYVVAKAAVEGMTEVLAYELAPKNIRVNVIRIGSVAGDAFLRPALNLLPPKLAAELYREVMPQHLECSKNNSLVGGIGTPEHIGSAVVYLMSPAGEYINASILPVDGAFNLVQIKRGRNRGSWSGNPVLQHWSSNPKEAVKGWLKAKGIEYEIE